MSIDSKIILRAQKYCAYQERSHQQVRDKLYEWGLHKHDVEQCIVDLIDQGFLNEQRFANAYSRGKLSIKRWGKNKIKYALKMQHNVSDRLIKDALNSLDEELYLEQLRKTMSSYFSKCKQSSHQLKIHKTAQHLIRKGYESSLVWEELKRLAN
ncbi:MAG TPA: regulatory protein RecX [Bacteroidia bacterium]|nr:regulatory protein RecX [Bacteroidia bacterium]HNT81151.1 regulatory protein RecX [Bacteroidia bacterium]